MSDRAQVNRERWQRVEEIFAQAIERSPADRAALLDDACAGDAALRAEVESLLAAEASAPGFIESPAIDVLAGELAPEFDDALVGAVLGSYQVGELIGSGGMGDVYRARDTQLQRDVALKVLPAVVDDAVEPGRDARIARFRREAKLLASLNHPNVGAIHGFVEGRIGRSRAGDAVYALALELVDGPTLAERIAEGPIPVADALAIARQIADGIQAAHAHGVIHRDLKPSNIKLRPDGTVKILDFGLAKALDDAAEAGGASPLTTPAGSPPSLQASTTLGTAAYMSPEQAQGRAVDQRGDVWAFGAVLFEMLTGCRAFEGRGVQDTLAAVLRHDVNWGALPAATPAATRALLLRCLARDPARRPRDLGEARRALEPPRPARISRRAAVATLGLGATAAAAAWYFAASPRRRRTGAVRLPFILPKEASVLLPASRQALAMSPDGALFVYAAGKQLYRRSLADLDAQPLAGTEGLSSVHQPTFSPDGRFVAFWAESDRTIKRVPVEGGSARTICAADNPFGMSWDDEGLLVGQGRRGILRVAVDSGSTQILIRVADGEEAHGPQRLSDGAILYTIATGVEWMRWEDARVVIQTPGSSERTTVVEQGADARVLPTGHLVFARGLTVLAAGFDQRRRQLTTTPVPVIEPVTRGSDRNTGTAQFSTSDTGRLVYVPATFIGPEWADVQLAIADRSGTLERLPLPPGPYRGVRASPTGRRFTFVTDRGPIHAIYTCNLDGRVEPRRLPGPGSNRHPLFATTADGERLVFQSDREGDRALYWQDPDGTALAERMTRPGPGESHAPESWSGETLLFSVIKGFDVSLWTLTLRDRAPVPFGGVHSAYPINARFSPDGRWIAYTTHDVANGTRTDIFVQPFPATGVTHRLPVANPPNAPTSTPHKPSWSPDGRELFYVPRLGAFEVVPIVTEPTFAFGPATPVKRQFTPGAPTFRALFDMMPDGRFIGVVPLEGNDSVANNNPGIQVVLDWFDELNSRVPL
jgi:eukaryotic-like serine/threonine-protein kinase